LQSVVDRRSDVFSLCVMLYEISTGTRLHDAVRDYDVMHQILELPPPPPASRRPGYPPALAEVVLRGLAKDPAARWQTAQELQIALEEVAASERIRVSPLSLARTVRELLDDRPEPDAAPRPVTVATMAEPRSSDPLPITLFKSAVHREHALAEERRLRGRMMLAVAEDLGVWAGENARREAIACLPPELDPGGLVPVRYLIALIELAASYGVQPSQLGALMHPRIRRASPDAFATPVRSLQDLVTIEAASTRAATDLETSFRFYDPRPEPRARRASATPTHASSTSVCSRPVPRGRARGARDPRSARCRWIDGDCTFDVALANPLR
jgi:hypothetical protein